MIHLEHLSIGYACRCLLSDVNTSFRRGTLTALLGRNGTGKSTLLRAIAGLNDRYSGNIVIDGRSLREMPATELARHLAVVTTERIRIPSLRCEDIVAMGRAVYTNWIGRMQDADRDAVRASLHAVGMECYARRTMDTMSDGECQRIMIARALAQDSEVILLDEPTSFLDLPSRYELCSLLARLCSERGKTIIFSTHELDLALAVSHNVALIDTPQLIVKTTAEMRASGFLRKHFDIDRRL